MAFEVTTFTVKIKLNTINWISAGISLTYRHESDTHDNPQKVVLINQKN